MDSKMLNDYITKITDYLDNMVQEGIPVIRYADESMDSDGIKIDHNLILSLVDGDLILERIIEVPATKFDPGDIFYEELVVASTLDEVLPAIKMALEENQEEAEALAWLDYENEIEDSEEEDEEDDL
jgi:hypothetical protein